MNCPHCGSSMKEEQVFCEVCGKERQLVPVFDAEIDIALQSTMSTIVDDLANTQRIVPNEITDELEKQIEEKKNESSAFENEKKESGDEKSFAGSTHLQIILYVVAALSAVILLVIVVLLLSLQKEDTSYEHQIRMAEKMEDDADYEQMLYYAQKAAASAPNSSDAKMIMARAYEGLHDSRSQIAILKQLIDADYAYAPAYAMLISLYEQEESYEEIGRLLSNCKEQEILDKYVAYQSSPPAFSEAAGVYQEIISLKILAPGNGDVYYTTNGSDPLQNGELYITPIIMGPGDHQVKAYYKNQYGINSEVVCADYSITIETLEEPFVSLESGFYDLPQLIVVENPSNRGQIYYTTDGSEPTVESYLYEKPIPLPLGESSFAFALFEEDKKCSETVMTTYHFVPDTAITLEQVRSMLMQALVQNHTLLDTGGNIAESEGYKDYKPFSATLYENKLCFLLSEEFVSPDGVVQKTGKLYAVCAKTGECYMTVQNSEGIFVMNKIQ